MTVPTAITFGEALIDEYPDRRVVAGAPLHVAVHFAGARWHSLLWSRVGPDPDAAAIRATLDRYGVDQALLQTDDEAPTGAVHIDLPDEGEHSFSIGSPAAWDHIQPASLPAHEVFYYGSLAARHPVGAATLLPALEVSPARVRVFDVNLREPHDDIDTVRRLLPHATLVKMNEDELRRVCAALGCSTDPHDLFTGFDRLEQVCVTRGADGAELHTRDGHVERIAAPSIDAVDTVGAGDAFAAGLTIGLVSGESPRMALRRATDHAATVLAVRGGLPPQ